MVVGFRKPPGGGGKAGASGTDGAGQGGTIGLGASGLLSGMMERVSGIMVCRSFYLAGAVVSSIKAGLSFL